MCIIFIHVVSDVWVAVGVSSRRRRSPVERESFNNSPSPQENSFLCYGLNMNNKIRARENYVY